MRPHPSRTRVRTLSKSRVLKVKIEIDLHSLLTAPVPARFRLLLVLQPARAEAAWLAPVDRPLYIRVGQPEEPDSVRRGRSVRLEAACGRDEAQLGEGPHDRLPPLERLDAHTPPELEDIVGVALERYATEVRADLVREQARVDDFVLNLGACMVIGQVRGW